MTTKILFHANCYDGFGAAWAAWKRFGNAAEYIPMNYDSPMPEINATDEVFMLDYCRKKDDLVRTALAAKHLIVLDHHKTAMPEVDAAQLELANWGGRDVTFDATIDIKRSGAMLSWDFFFSGTPAPRLIELIQDRDLWKFDLYRTRETHAYLCSQPMNFLVWNNIYTTMQLDASQIYVQGDKILQYHELLVEQFCKQVNFINVAGYYDIPIVNCSMLFSEVPHKLLEMYPDAPFAMYFYRRNGIWQYGLRSRGDVDVSKLAGYFGGGGHHNAAGFETTMIFAMESEKSCCEEHASEGGRGMVPELGMGYQGIQPQYIEKRKDPYQVPRVEVLRQQETVTITNQSSTTIFIDPAVVGSERTVLVPGGTLDLPTVEEYQSQLLAGQSHEKPYCLEGQEALLSKGIP